ncbi:hypothetical protein EST38_g4784 [Candolleomyces aberdarensis]|uniref:Cep57 centrosome microtubule-binding domain-containing protein n=1 Tax=Candolleomyces aberdarensis TaxID=2316362 RepID=A0A4Q2DNV8_9AGAR|nr:hypothetical protein EST38_g4784 [Candolleomyces aberdarensis]
MKRHTRGSAYDISIHRDQVEQHRRLLENRLKSNISIPVPPASDDEDYYHYQQNSSVEYPRHDSGPMPYPDFPSFAHRSREHFQDEDSHMHMGWSYRTGDDDDGINPYGGETMSTAAHHASAVTITAGLGGGRGHRRDVSMSGAEYDPERPLNQIMAGVGRMSMLDDPSKSKNTVNNITSDPIVVDSTAELDRILQSGYAPHNRSIHPTPPMSNASSSSSASDTEPGSPPRAKLSDHLRSPSPLAKRNQGNVTMLSANNSNVSTPRPTRRVSNPVQQTPHPEVRLQPATPSTGSSKFTRMARGITKEITETQSRTREDGHRPTSAPPLQQHRKASANEPPSKQQDAAPAKSNLSRRNFSKDLSRSRVVLPDVTGLTAAVESPARLGTTYYPYKGAGSREAEARLLQTLGQVQSKLQQLNDENGISRRRVRELEMELDECKRDVARERTRLLEQEEVIVQQQRELAGATSRAKGKAKEKVREKEVVEDSEEVMKRYKDAVEEKKALEALINSLRSHLTRLTSELASHTELLQELRELRETDSQSLREKGNDIARLKEDVERLEGEVEVLRGVVEEGLRERRAGREASMQQSQADIGMSRDLEEEEEEEEEAEAEKEAEKEGQGSYRAARQQEYSLAVASDSDDDDEEFESSIASRRQADRTMRTDHATLGSSTTTPHRVQFLDQQELQRIAAEVEERRSDRSFSMNESHNPLPSPRSRSPSLERRLEQPSFVYAERPTTPIPPSPSPSAAAQANLSKSRPAAARHATTSRKPSSRHQAETPFPQIRGERLERLFFSAPEHNPKTCTVCYRGRHDKGGDHHRGAHGHHAESDDEEEGVGAIRGHGHGGGQRRRGRTDPLEGMAGMVSRNELGEVPSDASYFRRVGNQAGLPPQTMAMRVIRELEDDFTHYKSIYVELADQYKEMDPVSDVPRRNMLAKHLREVVDVLERKGDQIASLSDLLAFKDNSKAKV